MKTNDILDVIVEHQKKWENGFYLIPSENFLSPVARIPFLFDLYNRYYLDDDRIFGYPVFPGGIELGELEKKYVIPRLNELLDSQYISLKPLSGMTALLIGLAGLVEHGSSIIILSPELGGHPSTQHIGIRLGIDIHYVPTNQEDNSLNWDELINLIKRVKPTLIYWDQGHVLFPDDPAKISRIVRAINDNIILYYDVSHLLGFILNGMFPSPLKCGFDIIGGSTHKSFPGPQKGFIATNNIQYFHDIQKYSDIFISHPQMANLVSLAIVLSDFDKGLIKEEITNSVKMAKYFGQCCVENGLNVFRAKDGCTETHQLWICLPIHLSVPDLSRRLIESGLFTNCFQYFKPTKGNCCRLGFNEMARLNVSDDDLRLISYYFSCAVKQTENPEYLFEKIRFIRSKYHHGSCEIFNTVLEGFNHAFD